jgi:hypothetical protein
VERVIATIASTTTMSRAAAISTAAVGLSPKIVVRSLTEARGSAEPPSSRRASVPTLPLALPDGGAGFVTEGELLELDELPPPAGGLTETDPDALPLALPEGAVAAGLEDPLPVPPVAWAKVSVIGAASIATPSRAMSKLFIPHLLRESEGARPVPLRRHR